MINLLLVDDEIKICSDIADNVLLMDFGIENCFMASNGREALETLKKNKIHIMITDIRMPEMDGIELLGNVRKLYPATHCMVLTAYNEFDYAVEALRLGADNFFLKPVNISEINEAVKDTVNSIHKGFENDDDSRFGIQAFNEYLLFRWASGTLLGQELINKANVCAVNVFLSCYMAAVLFIHENEQEAGQKMQDELYVLLSYDLDCYYYTESRNHIVFIVGGRREKIDNVRSKIRNKFSGAAGSEKNVIVMGDVVQGADSLHSSYEACKNLINYGMLISPHQVLCNEDVFNKTMEGKASDIEPVISLLYEQIQSSERIVADTINRFYSESGYSMGLVRQKIINILIGISQSVKERTNADTELPAYLKNMFSELENITSNEELVGFICSIIAKAKETIKQASLNRHPLIKRTMQYVDAYYSEPLSVKSLSEKFNANSSYMGELFREETGIFFSDYLNRIRIRKSRSLLLNTNLKTYEIAQRVGYASTSYFIKIFNEIQGMTPTKYRHQKSSTQ